MDEAEARRILGNDIKPDNSLYCLGRYLCWEPGQQQAVLDAEFGVEELEAIVWWMKNKGSASRPA